MQSSRKHNKGQIILLIALLAPFLLGMAGLGVDLVLAYAVKAQLTMTIDSVSLASMRALELGSSYADQEDEIIRVSNLMLSTNFPTGSLLTSNVRFSDPPKIHGANIPPGAGASFVQDPTVPAGVRQLRVTAEVTVPTMFMRIFGRDSLTVRSTAVASRQDVNLVLVLDRSGSLNQAIAPSTAIPWPSVQSAVKTFVGFFDNNADRVGMISYATSSHVDYPISTGFKTNNAVENMVNMMEAKGGTNAALGLWLGYGELLRVNDPNSLNVIVFFTDGQPTAFPALFNTRTSGSYRCDSAQKLAVTQALFTTLPNGDRVPNNVGTFNVLMAGPAPVLPGAPTDIEPITGCVGYNNWLPTNTELFWDPGVGMPTHWTATYDDTMSCQTCTQTYTRTFEITNGPYNAYNGAFDMAMFSDSSSGGVSRANKAIGAAQNLAVDVVQTAQDDPTLGAVVVYTIGLGNIDPEILGRMANDIDAPTYTSARKEGEFLPAPTVNDLKAAFQKVRSQIIRLTR